MINNPQIAFITDTHFGARGNCEHFNENFLKFFSDIFFPEIKKRGIKTVIHLGDLGNYRKQINTKILTSWKKQFFEPLRDFNCYFIVGNHDCYYKSTNLYNLQHSLSLETNFGFTIADVELVTLPEFSIDLLPWVSSEQRSSLLSSIEKSTSKYLLGHLEFTSSETPYTDSQISLDVLDKYQKVFSGHFHKRVQVSPTISYIGSAYPITWADYDQDRGFSLFNPLDGSIEFIKNPLSLFHKVYFNSPEDLKTIDVSLCSGKHTLISISSSSNNLGETLDFLIKQIETTNPLSLVIKKDESFIQEGYAPSDINFSKDTFFYMKQYINNVFKDNSLDLSEEKVLKQLHLLYSHALQLNP